MDFTLPWNKIKILKWSDFFQIEHDPLVFLQIIPNISIKNGMKINNILHGLHAIKSDVIDRIKFKDAKIIYKKKDIISYAILYQKDKITFHLAVPSKFENFITQRIYSVWQHCTVLSSKEDYLDLFNKEKTLEIQLQQKYHCFKSLLGDYRENAPIPSLLAVSKDIQDDDKAVLEIILNPINDYWKDEAEIMYKKFKKGLLSNEDKPSGKIGLLFYEITKLIDKAFESFDMLMGVKIEQNQEDKIKQLLAVKISETTRQKIKYDGFQGNIRILSQSNDNIRREQTSNSIMISLRDIEDQQDNELKIKTKKLNPKSLKRKVSYFSKDIYSSKELGTLMQMPEAKWQTEYPVVDNIKTQEINLPSQLFQDGIPIGYVKYKGQTKLASWNTKDKDVCSMPVAFYGMMGSGKTEALINYAVSAIEKEQALFIFDGIKNCEMSDKIRDYLPSNFPDNKIVELDFSNLEFLIPLAWNEVNINKFDKQSDKMLMANHLSQQLMYLLDTFVDDPKEKLSARMRRYLNSASLLVFSMPNTAIMDVLNVLTDYYVRHEFIDKSNFKKDSKIINDLLMLDDVKVDKNGNVVSVGTKENLINGITDRLDRILGDYVLNSLFSCKNNNKIDFLKWANEGYVVLCKMPQTRLNDQTINILTAFLMSKIWLAILMRGEAENKNYRICNVINDEVHKIPTATKILDNIREQRKYRLKSIFSAHQPKDFKSLLPTLKSAGCSHIIYKTSKDNLKYFEEELKPFTIEECMDTKKYHAKCVVNFDKEYVTFDAKIVPPVEQTKTFKNRSHISQISAEKYGVKNDE